MSERLPSTTTSFDDEADARRLQEFIKGGVTRDGEEVIFYHPDGDVRTLPIEGGVFHRMVQGTHE